MGRSRDVRLRGRRPGHGTSHPRAQTLTTGDSRLGPPWRRPFHGRLEEAELDSTVLASNPLGDPATRPIWVYLPPAYDREPDRRFPAIYLIQGMTGQLDMWRNRSAFRPNTPELIDALFAGDDPPPAAIVVFVDCWTSYGGSQFLDSPGTGRYQTYLCDEVVPWVDARYRTLADREHRAISGKSSGGYGAMVTPMLRPDLFGALATHAGDALFEICYLPEFGPAARTLRDEYEGSWQHFWADFRARPAFSRARDDVLVNEYAMAACYSADEDGTIRLPFDPTTGELDDVTWQRWLRWDPVRMARTPDGRAALAGLRAIYIDAGKRDEYHLDLGAEAFRRAAVAAGAPAPFFELFDAGHGAIEYRYPLAIRFLAEAMATAG
jgi:S-formylglutathione hydrolase FrmB